MDKFEQSPAHPKIFYLPHVPQPDDDIRFKEGIRLLCRLIDWAEEEMRKRGLESEEAG